ncbi:MAG TPA: sigma-70 family RNA polymerase sigma factor [Terriglobales bacterium]|jgi:RNA polymerase sigma-70 factor (ECF subfamily)|nr:sigma-70 family RNA polymerase sigma factor [Terriglobales bacterium]
MRPQVEEAFRALRDQRPGALERALSLLEDTVFSFSMKVCGHRQDAEDTMQETLLRALPQLDKISSPQGLAVWLYKVARSRCLMSRRKSKFAPRHELSLEGLMPDRRTLESLASPGSTPEGSVLSRESSARLKQAIHRLPPAYRLVLVLHDMEELSTGEVARIVGLREPTVRVRLHRARIFLRNELAGAGKRRARRAPAPAVPASRRCRQLFAALSDYLDDALDETMCDALEKHLDGCHPCEAFLTSLEQTVEQCRQFQPGHPARKLTAQARRELLDKYRSALQSANRR